MAVCPECAFDLKLNSDLDLGEIVVCDNCGVDLIVSSINPIDLEAFEEEEK